MSNYWIFVGGTGEKPGKEQLAYQMLTPLIAGDDTVNIVGYPASIGIFNPTRNPVDVLESSYQSRELGVSALFGAINTAVLAGARPILVGYSLGAWIVSQALEQLGRGQHGVTAQVKAAVTIGNPRRASSNPIWAHGIAGPHEIFPPSIPHVEIWEPDDVICNTPAKSVLRKLPFIAEVFTGKPDQQTLNTWRSNAGVWMARQWTFPTPRDLELVAHYVDGTGHVKDYIATGHNHWQKVARVL